MANYTSHTAERVLLRLRERLYPDPQRQRQESRRLLAELSRLVEGMHHGRGPMPTGDLVGVGDDRDHTVTVWSKGRDKGTWIRFEIDEAGAIAYTQGHADDESDREPVAVEGLVFDPTDGDGAWTSTVPNPHQVPVPRQPFPMKDPLWVLADVVVEVLETSRRDNTD
ncbi:MAG: hypothetical protein RIF41_20000 [Polyangiaceae bacterium]